MFIGYCIVGTISVDLSLIYLPVGSLCVCILMVQIAIKIPSNFRAHLLNYSAMNSGVEPYVCYDVDGKPCFPDLIKPLDYESKDPILSTWKRKSH